MCCGRRPSGPPADPGGKLFTACLTSCSDTCKQISEGDGAGGGRLSFAAAKKLVFIIFIIIIFLFFIIIIIVYYCHLYYCNYYLLF